MAGVSTATVNRVLKNNGYVSADARSKVEDVVKRTGYRPNIVARGLRTNKSFTIGLLITSLTDNPFFVNVAKGFELAALKEGYSTIIVNHDGDGGREMTLRLQPVDAIVHARGPRAQQSLDKNVPVARSNVPLVRTPFCAGRQLCRGAMPCGT
jgi:LacI family transcriptional regulator